ncbi:hypothetical protein J7M23_06175, partial [Candidatus Sumerlaeota bacterium]|nr:hypothetical protein [Candidatus Sumerlaeota bacterium]
MAVLLLPGFLDSVGLNFLRSRNPQPQFPPPVTTRPNTPNRPNRQNGPNRQKPTQPTKPTEPTQRTKHSEPRLIILKLLAHLKEYSLFNKN